MNFIQKPIFSHAEATVTEEIFLLCVPPLFQSNNIPLSLIFHLVFSLSTSANVSLSSTDRNQSQAAEIPWTPATSCRLWLGPKSNERSLATERRVIHTVSCHHNCNHGRTGTVTSLWWQENNCSGEREWEEKNLFYGSRRKFQTGTVYYYSQIVTAKVI